MGSREHLESFLKDKFGYETFKEGQLEVIQGVLKKKDVLATMPTGGGKSLTYQLLASFCPNKMILVISPLTTLLIDQV